VGTRPRGRANGPGKCEHVEHDPRDGSLLPLFPLFFPSRVLDTQEGDKKICPGPSATFLSPSPPFPLFFSRCLHARKLESQRELDSRQDRRSPPFPPFKVPSRSCRRREESSVEVALLPPLPSPTRYRSSSTRKMALARC